MAEFEKTSSSPLLSHPANGAYGEDGEGPTYSVDEAIDALGLGRFQYLVLAMAGLCWTADAMEMLLLSFIKAPLQCLWGISDVQAALITTSVGVGMLFGALTWGLVADAYGRRLAFISAASLTFSFGLLSAAAPSYPAMVVTRGVVGFGIGGVPIAFSLVMEFLPGSARGRWGMGLAVFWSVGAMFEAALAMYLMPRAGFRALIAGSTLPLGALLLLTPLLPESPRWLAARGRLADAEAVLAHTARVNAAPLPPGRLAVPPHPTQPPRRGSAQLAALVRPGRRALTAAVWFLWFSSAFVYYGSVMLQPDLLAAENAGARCRYTAAACAALRAPAPCRRDALCAWAAGGGGGGGAMCVAAGTRRGRAAVARALAGASAEACPGALRRADYANTLWATSGEVPGIVVTLLTVDAVGRRPLLGYLFVLCVGAFLALLPCPGRQVETLAFFVARAASNGFFQAIYLYTNELEPTDVRATGMGVASAVARVGLISTPLVAQFLDNVNFVLAIAIYAMVCVLGLAMVCMLPVETAKRPLFESVDALIAALAAKPQGCGAPTFANDPAANAVARFFRWPAQIDGRASAVEFC